MYKFGKEPTSLGMRFYKFIAEDEYKIFVLVKILDDSNAQFMDEETFELVNIDSDTLSHEYTLLLNYHTLKFTLPDKLNNKRFEVHIVSYLFLRRIVFEQTLNNILILNFGYTPESGQEEPIYIESELGSMHYNYVRDMYKYLGSTPILWVSRFDNSFDGERLSDAIIMEAEERLSTYILSYDIFEYDESVNFDYIDMKYFFVYSEQLDKFYIVLYLIDTEKVSAKILEDMEENIDLIEFMDQ